MLKPDLRYTSARRLLRDFNDVNALRKNPLLAAYTDESHDRLQARILRAVESLDPGLVVTRTSGRRNRLYQILCRCDLRGESRNEVAAALEISRSQFYVDRRKAFLLVADAIEQLPAQPRIDGPLSDAISQQHRTNGEPLTGVRVIR